MLLLYAPRLELLPRDNGYNESLKKMYSDFHLQVNYRTNALFEENI